jgi:MFS family permease
MLLVTQAWMALCAGGLALATGLDLITPGLLLLFTGLLGLGSALNAPAWQAIQPELVPREELPAAVTLGSIGFNIARSAGPALGGLLVAVAGPEATFLLNALSFAGVIAVLARWRRQTEASVLPAERFFGAMRTGMQYVRHAPEVLAVIARGGAFVLCGSAVWALLPVVARRELASGPAGYGLLLTALGIGAVSGAMILPRLRRRFAPSVLVALAVLVFAAATAVLATVPSFWPIAGALCLGGGAWLTLLSGFNVALQTVVPGWVRARALSVYLLAFYAGLTAGSALWGGLAERFGLRAALLAAAAGQIVGLLATFRLELRTGEGLNLSPSRQWPVPVVQLDLEPERGPVLVTVQYRVAAERAAEFAAAMRAVRRIRLRDGAMQWGLFADAAAPDRRVEVFLVRSWLEHLRQHERATWADRAIEEEARAFHTGDGPPVVHHLISEPVLRD